MIEKDRKTQGLARWVMARQIFRSLPIEVSEDGVRLLGLIVQFLSFFGMDWFGL